MRISRPLSTFAALVTLASLLFAFPLGIAAQSQFPPCMQKMLRIIQSHRKPTPQEVKEMQNCGKEMQKSQKQNVKKGCGTARLAVRALNSFTYLPFVKQMRSLYGQKAGKARTKIDALLAEAKSSYAGSNLGAVFLSMGAGSAAVYATGWSALRLPRDPVVAGNLGAGLKAMADYSHAAMVLLYADDLSPRNSLIAANLGWTYYEAGDTADAQIWFARALKLRPHFASAEEGLGFVAKCKGNLQQAKTELQASVSDGFTDSAQATLTNLEMASHNSTQNNTQNPNLPTPPSNNESTLNLPKPLFTTKQIVAWTTQHNQAVQKWTQMTPLYLSAEEALHKPQITKDGEIIPYNYDKEQVMLATLMQSLAHDLAPPAKRTAKKGGEIFKKFLADTKSLGEREMAAEEGCGDNSGCHCQVKADFNKQLLQLESATEKEAHDTFVNGYWKIAAPRLKAFYAISNPILARIQDPVVNAYWNQRREITILEFLMGGGLDLLRGEYYPYVGMPPPPPTCNLPSAPPPPEAAPLQSIDQASDPNQCPTSSSFGAELGFDDAFVGVSGDSCGRVKVSLGMEEGIMGSLQYDAVNSETTLFVGGHGAIPGISVEAGTYMTVSPEGVSDLGGSFAINAAGGLQSEVEVSALSGATEVSAGYAPSAP